MGSVLQRADRIPKSWDELIQADPHVRGAVTAYLAGQEWDLSIEYLVRGLCEARKEFEKVAVEALSCNQRPLLIELPTARYCPNCGHDNGPLFPAEAETTGGK